MAFFIFYLSIISLNKFSEIKFFMISNIPKQSFLHCNKPSKFNDPSMFCGVLSKLTFASYPRSPKTKKIKRRKEKIFFTASFN